jgi:hypothetical protein
MIFSQIWKKAFEITYILPTHPTDLFGQFTGQRISNVHETLWQDENNSNFSTCCARIDGAFKNQFFPEQDEPLHRQKLRSWPFRLVIGEGRPCHVIM